MSFHVLITEVLYDAPNNDATEEWIELFNPSSLPISIESWTISDNVGSFSLIGIIPSGGYFTIARNDTAFQNLYGFSANITGSNLALGNSGDLITLSDVSNNEIDMVAWENKVVGWDISAIDTTIRRISNNDTDSVIDWEKSNSLGDPGSGSYIVMPPDDISPIVSFDNLVNGSIVNGIIQIQIIATDNDNVASYEILIDDEIKSTTNFFNWNTLIFLNGTHSILGRAQDNSGNWGEILINVIIDNSNFIPPDTPPFKFMTYNIEAGGSNVDWINVVKAENPDIIVYVETGNWDDSSNALFNQHLTEFNNYFSDELPYTGNTGQNIGISTSGEAIMSRFPILSTTQLAVVQLDDSSFFDVSHDFMIWEIDVNGEIIYIIGAHLKCCGGSINEEKRERAQEGIINYMDALGDVPIIYAGDLNSFSPFDTGNLAPKGNLASGPLSMMLDPQHPTYGVFSSSLHIFVDTFRELNPSIAGYTYGHQNPSYTSRIDFIIANQHFTDGLINSTTGDLGLANTGSDHYNVDVFIQLGINVIPVDPNNETSNTQTNSEITSTNAITSTQSSLSGTIIGTVTTSISQFTSHSTTDSSSTPPNNTLSNKQETIGSRVIIVIIAVLSSSILFSTLSRRRRSMNT